jgi:hypothetical protein
MSKLFYPQMDADDRRFLLAGKAGRSGSFPFGTAVLRRGQIALATVG